MNTTVSDQPLWFCVLGQPVRHSLSPLMMTAAFQALAVDAQYYRFDVAPHQFNSAVRGLSALGATGANVTLPHKLAALRIAGEVTEVARLAGAVNTLRFDPDGGIAGHNTDVGGWWTSVSSVWRASDRRRVALLGAGGAARAVLAALAVQAAEVQVAIAARRLDVAAHLASEFGQRLSIAAIPWDERCAAAARADLVVNATSIGMWPNVNECVIDDCGCLSSGQVVQDMVYRPLDTSLLRRASAAGATPVDGVGMLVGQGAEALAYWLGCDAPTATMQRAVQHALAFGEQ